MLVVELGLVRRAGYRLYKAYAKHIDAMCGGLAITARATDALMSWQNAPAVLEAVLEVEEHWPWSAHTDRHVRGRVEEKWS